MAEDMFASTEMSPHLKDFPDEGPYEPPDYYIPNVIPRIDWQGVSAKERIPIDLPIKYVFYTAETEFQPCSNQQECCAEMRKIQNHYMGKGYADIPYNFVIGNDGNVYEGRGWWFGPGPEGYEVNKNLKANDKINIAVICGHNEIIPEKMDMVREAFKLADKFVEFGVKRNMIVKNHEHLFSHDITAETPKKVVIPKEKSKE